MRIIVMFDLPTDTLDDKREYRKFRKFLIKNGFLMMQESIYTKMALNRTVASSVEKSIKNNKPSKGLVQMLIITEKQFAGMEYIVGSKQSNIVDSDSRVIEL